MGHDTQHAGLQQHSVGETYPWTVRQVGNTCQAFNCITGKAMPAQWEFDQEQDANGNTVLVGFEQAYAQAEADMPSELIDMPSRANWWGLAEAA